MAALLFLTVTAANAQKKTHLVFSPQWHAQAQFAGYIMAKHLGFYEEEGLDVKIKYPTETTSSLDLLSEGKAQIVTNMLSTVLVQVDKKQLDVVNVLQTSQHGSICLVRKPGASAVNSKMLKGMRVGLWYNGLAMPAEMMNAAEALDWQIVRFREGFNLMNYDMVDAVSAMEYNELLRMKYCGRDVSDKSVLHLCEAGYDVPEDGIYCMRSFYNEHKPEVEAFIRATKKGWEWCRQHQEETVEHVIKEMRSEFIYSSAVIQRASLKVILKKQEITPGKVSYSLQRHQFEEAIHLLKEAHMISGDIEYHNFVTR